MSNYKLLTNSELPNHSESVQNLDTLVCIPFDPANTDYQRYLKWLDGYEEVNGEWVKTSDGNTPLPADQ